MERPRTGQADAGVEKDGSRAASVEASLDRDVALAGIRAILDI